MSKPKAIPHTVTLANAISEGYSELQILRDEMTEWADNMEEKLSHTTKYEAVRGAADELDQVCDGPSASPEHLLPAGLSETQIQVQTYQNPRGLSRAQRRDNATAYLETVVGLLEDHLENLKADAEADAAEAADNARGEVEDAAEDAAAEAKAKGEAPEALTTEEINSAAEAAAEDARANHQEKLDALSELIDELQNTVDTAQSVEFPGMYG